MTARKPMLIFSAGLAFGGRLLLRAADTSVAEQDARRLQIVMQYADHVLADASDHYRKEPSPLLALAATIKDVSEKISHFIGGFEFFSGDCRFPDGRVACIHEDVLCLLRQSAPTVPFPRP